MIRREWIRWYLLLIVLSVSAGTERTARSQEGDAPDATPIAQFITVASPVDESVYGTVTTAALSLEHQAEQEGRRAILVLEITRGSSQFHQVQGLADFLASTKLSNVTTVAWIPETVIGHNAILALACNEIVMHPDAELGDIGRGETLDRVDQQFVLSIVERRLNSKVNSALALGMMDPQKVVLKIQRQIGAPGNESLDSQVVTLEELQLMLKTKAVVTRRDTLKEAGDVGTFSGAKARTFDILVVQLAETRADLADRYGLPRETMRERATVGREARARLIKIDGMIEPVLATFVKRQIERAVSFGANVLIFEIDSPGGYLTTSQDLANTIADLDPKTVRTIAYVPKQALSGAAMVALGCDEIYLHPEGLFGDAGPIEIGEGQQFQHAPEKILSPLREMQRALAEKKDRPAALAIAMADSKVLVYQVTHHQTGRTWYMTEDEIDAANGEWIKGEIVPESREDLLLTVNGERAHELKLAGPAVADMDELKKRIGVPLEIDLVPIEPTWVDQLIFFLNTRAALALLTTIAIICIVVELHVMTGLLGIISAVCFALIFWSRVMGGTAGYLEVLLFLLGLACVVLEVFVIPGFGVFGVSGGLLMVASLVLASQTFGEIGGRQADSDFARLTYTVESLSASIVVVIVMAIAMSRFLPKMPLVGRMVLTPPGYTEAGHENEPRLRPELAAQAEGDPMRTHGGLLIGDEGEAVSVLRPAGKAQISGQYVDVVSDGPFIEQGCPIRVVNVKGNLIVVRQV